MVRNSVEPHLFQNSHCTALQIPKRDTNGLVSILGAIFLSLHPGRSCSSSDEESMSWEEAKNEKGASRINQDATLPSSSWGVNHKVNGHARDMLKPSSYLLECDYSQHRHWDSYWNFKIQKVCKHLHLGLQGFMCNDKMITNFYKDKLKVLYYFHWSKKVKLKFIYQPQTLRSLDQNYSQERIQVIDTDFKEIMKSPIITLCCWVLFLIRDL